MGRQSEEEEREMENPTNEKKMERTTGNNGAFFFQTVQHDFHAACANTFSVVA